MAFEADRFDETVRDGWSVTMIGQTRPVDDSEDADHLMSLPLQSWTLGPDGHFVWISSQYISGRRIHQVSPAPGSRAA